ncbi:MAG: site-specific integrase [Clostridia bacterium]|nr:site-specific integrase [Clostridia bacterium]
MKYKYWVEEWLKLYVEPSTKLRTYIRYREIATNRLIVKFGEYDLDKITPKIIQSYITELLKTGNNKTHKGLSSSSVNLILNVMLNSLKRAYDNGYKKEYNYTAIKRPTIKEKEVNCFTLKEQKKIENYVLNSKNKKLFGIILCLYTGLRIGELLALKWTDIDFKDGLLFINKECYLVKDDNNMYTRKEDTPKTKSSIRIIPLPKQIIPLIKKIKSTTESSYVISNKGNPISIRSYQRSFELLLKKLGIEHKGFHALRHTFATRAIECNMDIRTLSEILGHKNPMMTLNRYAHSLMEHKKEMMNRLGKIMI